MFPIQFIWKWSDRTLLTSERIIIVCVSVHGLTYEHVGMRTLPTLSSHSPQLSENRELQLDETMNHQTQAYGQFSCDSHICLHYNVEFPKTMECGIAEISSELIDATYNCFLCSLHIIGSLLDQPSSLLLLGLFNMLIFFNNCFGALIETGVLNLKMK